MGRYSPSAAILLLFWVNGALGQHVFETDRRVNQDSAGRHMHYPGFTNGRSVAVFGDRVYCLWFGNQENGSNYHIYLSRSTNGGSSFLASVRVDSGSISLSTYYPAFALDLAGNIYCVWEESLYGPYPNRLLCAKSTDGGASFFQQKVVSVTDTICPQLPSLVCDHQGTLLAVWCVYQDLSRTGTSIHFAKSTDGGNSFTVPVRVSPASVSLHASTPVVAVDGAGVVHVVWRDDRQTPFDYHVYYSRSTDGGNTFSASILVDSSVGSYSATFPSLICDSGGRNVYVLYKDRSSGGHQIYLSRSTDGGLSFSGHTRIDSIGLQTSDYPQISVLEPANLFFTWTQDAGSGMNSYFRSSSDGGASFSPIHKVNTPESHCVFVHTAVAPDRTVYCAWADRRNGTLHPDIYFIRGVPMPGTAENSPDTQPEAPVLSQNPVQSSISIRLPPGVRHPVVARLCAASGRLVRLWRIVPPGQSASLTGVPPGIYYLQTGTGSQRVVVIR